MRLWESSVHCLPEPPCAHFGFAEEPPGGNAIANRVMNYHDQFRYGFSPDQDNTQKGANTAFKRNAQLHLDFMEPLGIMCPSDDAQGNGRIRRNELRDSKAIHMNHRPQDGMPALCLNQCEPQILLCNPRTFNACGQ